MTTSPRLWLGGGGVTLTAHPRPRLLELVWVALKGPRWVNGEEYVGVYQRQQSTTKWSGKSSTVNNIIKSSNQALFFSFLFFLRQHSAVTETSSLISFYFLGGTMSTAIKTSSFFSFFFSFLCSTVLSPKNALFFFFLKTHCLTDTMN